MKKTSIYIVFSFVLMLNLCACGYKIHGYNKDNTSLIGDGTSTVSIGEVHHNSLYTDVPYIATSQIRDEIVLRRLGIWKSQGEGKYSISLNIPTFRLRNFESSDIENALVSSLDINIIMSIIDNASGQIIWTSHRISYSENYENPRESTVVTEVLTDVIKQAFDLFQSASF